MVDDERSADAPNDEEAEPELHPAAVEDVEIAEVVEVEEPSPAPTYRGAGIRWSYLFGSVLTVAIIILAAQNTESVEFEFLTWNYTAPLAAVILATAFVAIVIDELIGVIWRFRRRRQLRQRAELDQLRQRLGEPSSRFGRKR